VGNIIPSHRAFATNSASSCHLGILESIFKVANHTKQKQNCNLSRLYIANTYSFYISFINIWLKYKHLKQNDIKEFNLITKTIIDDFIRKVPPSPKILKVTLSLLNGGELVKAAQIAKEDLALSAYLKDLVNKPIYGFRTQVSEISQIFGILGVAKSQQVVYNYMVALLSPDKWKLFKLNKSSFYSLQADLTANWQKILAFLEINDKEVENAIALLPASVIVSEALFSEKLDDVNLLRSVNPIDLNSVLKRLCGVDLFDICAQIATKWEMDEKVALIVQAASGVKPANDAAIDKLGKWMHLLLFYILSQPNYVDAGLNDFIDFQIDYVQDVYDDFAKIMEIGN
jgi:HD-like signal output (HDOD) protein